MPLSEAPGHTAPDLRGSWQASVSRGDQNLARTTLSFTAFNAERLATTPIGKLMAGVFQNAERPDIAMVLKATTRIEHAEGLGPSHVDRVIAGGSALLVDGWIANLPGRQMHLVTSDFGSWVPQSAWALRARQDVHDHLASIQALTTRSNEHGFVAIVPNADEAVDKSYYLVALEPDAQTAAWFGPIHATTTKDDAEAILLVRSAFGDIQSLPRHLASQIYHPLLAKPENEAIARPFRFGPSLPSGVPLVSIIVPFYGDGFFINCIHHLQRVLGEGFELVLVVDDARIFSEIYNNLNNRSTAITVPTVLLQNAENYGYGRANNLGFLAASGDVVLLMNSDIMVLDAAPLRGAAEAIRGRKAQRLPELVVGFSLLYEDNTIQHIGMEFPRSSQVGNMRLADHPMKGLPYALYSGGPVIKVRAVTAALMCLSADLYRDLGGFDSVYVRGDFEDADLCLRAEQLGADMEVHVSEGLYHLERQSIPSMGDHDLRGMVTYLNCVTFNRRWEDHLSEPAPMATGKRVHQIVSRKRA